MYEYRPIEPDEISLVLDSWAKGWRTSEYAGTVPNHLFFPTHREMIAGLIGRGAKLVAAVNSKGRVAGYVCYEHKGDDTVCLHWCYVKDPFRREGLGTELVKYAVGDRPVVLYSHRTRYAKYVLPRGARHVPEVARRKTL